MCINSPASSFLCRINSEVCVPHYFPLVPSGTEFQLPIEVTLEMIPLLASFWSLSQLLTPRFMFPRVISQISHESYVIWKSQRGLNLNYYYFTIMINMFIGRTYAEAEALILWPPDAKSWLIRKDPDARKDWRQEEKEKTEDEMVGWHHQLDGHEFEQAPGVGDGQGSLACCSLLQRVAKSRPQLNDWTEWLVTVIFKPTHERSPYYYPFWLGVSSRGLECCWPWTHGCGLQYSWMPEECPWGENRDLYNILLNVFSEWRMGESSILTSAVKGDDALKITSSVRIYMLFQDEGRFSDKLSQDLVHLFGSTDHNGIN